MDRSAVIIPEDQETIAKLIEWVKNIDPQTVINVTGKVLSAATSIIGILGSIIPTTSDEENFLQGLGDLCSAGTTIVDGKSKQLSEDGKMSLSSDDVKLLVDQMTKIKSRVDAMSAGKARAA